MAVQNETGRHSGHQRGTLFPITVTACLTQPSLDIPRRSSDDVDLIDDIIGPRLCSDLLSISISFLVCNSNGKNSNLDIRGNQ